MKTECNLGHWLLLACGVTLVAACGGGGGGSSNGGQDSDNQPPTASAQFPLSGSWTTGSLIGVRGTAADPDGDGIVSVTVNGVLANTDDGFATWRVPELTLQDGTNTLTGLVQDAQGNVGTFSLTLEKRAHPGIMTGSPMTLTADPDQPRLLVVDRSRDALLSVDMRDGPGKGYRTVLSRRGDGKGTNLNSPSAADIDPENRRVVVLENYGRLLEIDLASGERTELFAGLKVPNAMVVDPVNGRILVGENKIPTNDNNGVDGLFEFDLADPASSGYDPTDRPGSPNVVITGIPSPVSIDLDPDNPDRALVVSTRVNVEAVFEVDVASRTKTRIATFANPSAVAFYPDGSNRALVASAGALLEVDLDDASKVLMSGRGKTADIGSSETKGLGLLFMDVRTLLFDPDNDDRVLLTTTDLPHLFSVDLMTGERAALEATLGGGPDFYRPTMVTLVPGSPDQPPAAVILEDILNGPKMLHGINLAPGDHLGDRTTLSGFNSAAPDQPTGAGVTLASPRALALDAARRRVLVLDQADGGKIVTVDMTTGDRAILSGDGTGSGPAFSSPHSIFLDTDNHRAFVAASRALFAVDLETGARAIVSDEDTGSGPLFFRPVSLVLDADNQRLLLTEGGDESLAVLMAVDLQTGDRTLISGDGIGTGVDMSNPVSVSLDVPRNRALVLDGGSGGSLLAVDLATGNRSIVSASTLGPDRLFNTDDDEMIGQGSPFNPEAQLSGASFDVDNRVLFVTDRQVGSLIAIDVDSGDRVLVSGFAF